MDLYKKERMRANVYFMDALKHYVTLQDEFDNLIPENLKPSDINRIPIPLVESIISYLSDSTFKTSAVSDVCIRNATPRNKMVDLEAMYVCPDCGTKSFGEVAVKTNLDHIELTRNGDIDMSAVSEFTSTKEEISLDVKFPEELFSKCSCADSSLKEEEKQEKLYKLTFLSIVLDDEAIAYFKKEEDGPKKNVLRITK